LLRRGERVSDLSICQEAKWLIGWHIGQGVDAPQDLVTPFGDRLEYKRWSESRKQAIAFWLSRIRHWKVVLGDYTDAPDIQATWFVDPPYDNQAGKHYPYNNVNYDTLATWCKSRRGLVIVCENVGATWLPFRPLFNNKGCLNVVRQEALWVGVNNDN
jgi:hypothetical protein